MNNKGGTAVLLLSCQDQKGLVATVADFIYRNSGNIIHADQHTDQEAGTFVQRIEWELEDFHVSRKELPQAFKPIAHGFGMTWSLHFSDYVPRIAIFVSKLAHCLYDLLARQRMGELKVDIPLIVSNHPDLAPIAEKFGVEFGKTRRSTLRLADRGAAPAITTCITTCGKATITRRGDRNIVLLEITVLFISRAKRPKCLIFNGIN